LEHRIVKPDGEVRVVHRQAEVVRAEGGEPIRMVGTVHDVTECKALEEQLQHQALHDPLTGLPNRTLFSDRLRQALARAKRRGTQIAVLFMDLDNFKVINDSLGHKAGDRILVAVSKRMKALLRPEDTVARLGGDEFVVLFKPRPGYLQASQSAERLAHMICQAIVSPIRIDTVHHGSTAISVSASAGVAVMPAHRLGQLISAADIAMYRAKTSGATVCRYQPHLDRAPEPGRRPAQRLRDQRTRRDPLVGLPAAHVPAAHRAREAG
jgi:diguanylate cyclase (GGDEF)-like protein